MTSRAKIKGGDKAKARIKKLVKEFDKNKLLSVGLPQGSNPYPDGTSVIDVGIAHEFGTETLPERSFLRATLAENKQKYRNFMKRIPSKIINGQSKSETEMERLGLVVSSDCKSRIYDGIEPKKKRGEGVPLIDTGHLVESITYVVHDAD